MYFPKPSLNENDMAIIERGDTAAHSIEAGQYVSWHGKTGKAKAAILQGATLEDTLFDYSGNGAINELNASLTLLETVVNHAGGSVAGYGQIYVALGQMAGYHPISVRTDVIGGGNVLALAPYKDSDQTWTTRCFNTYNSSLSYNAFNVYVTWQKDY